MKSLSIGHYGVSHSCYEVTGVTWQTEQLQSIHLRYIRGRREEQLCAEWVCYALEKGHRIPPRRKSPEHMDREPGVPERISKYRKALGKEQGSADPDRTSPATFAIANRIEDVVYEGRSGEARGSEFRAETDGIWSEGQFAHAHSFRAGKWRQTLERLPNLPGHDHVNPRTPSRALSESITRGEIHEASATSA